ncbi:uncharacterized protein L203_102954 [Cryptococcus depauperatus CBS 7841]|uniref:Oxidation resistance protein 1 n=1 Tax=Cryptococcus depauperatus CBS 7841 TaxID=1295531 RepID=A0AAJ8JSS1_9TREE
MIPQLHGKQASGSSSHRSHPSSSSADFGEFTSAEQPNQLEQSHSTPSSLEDGDLLVSYNDLGHQISPSKPAVGPYRQSSVQFDLLSDHDDKPQYEHSQRSLQQSPEMLSSFSEASTNSISINSAPLETSSNHAAQSPPSRRLSSTFLSNPSSPPLLTDAGNDIVFHPSQATSYTAMQSMQKVQEKQTGATNAPPNVRRKKTSPEDKINQTLPHSPSHSLFLNSLATTTKLASRWRSVITQGANPSQANGNTPGYQLSPTLYTEPLPVTHETPFASAEELAGSYVAPTGAPGFNNRERKSGAHLQENDEWSPVKLLGRREISEKVLGPSDAQKLRICLPPRQRLSNQWTLLFSIDQHGSSLSTLYRRIEQHSIHHSALGYIIAILDGQSNQFGVYTKEPITKHEGTYYGSGESFLFKKTKDSQLSVYRWTGKNQYFSLCESGFISFGGGAGTYGLILDATFSHNSSATCPTYNNDVLCEQKVTKSPQSTPFECLGLEVWAIK